jgi:predicted XRE-type DNA-binding protein
VKPISFLMTASIGFATFRTMPDRKRVTSLMRSRSAPIPTIGSRETVSPGVREIGIKEDSGAFRAIYPATPLDAVLSCTPFRKDAGDTTTGCRSNCQPLTCMEAKVMKIQTFDNAFDALADTPAEVADIKARSELLSAPKARARSWNLSQEVAASRLGITRARLNDLLQGKVANSRSMHWSPRHGLWPGCAYPGRRSGLTAQTST